MSASAFEPLRRPRLRDALTVPALLALFGVSLRQAARPRRLIVLGLVLLVPCALVLLGRSLANSGAVPPWTATESRGSEYMMLLVLMPGYLVPFVALLFAAGMVRDEVEGQTLTYLLIRPLWRPAIYLAKMLTAWFAATVLVGLAVAATYAALYIGLPGGGAPPDWPARGCRAAAAFGIELFAYVGAFGLLSLLTRRVAVIGVIYVLFFEGVFANIDFVVRQGTILYHLRTIAWHWLAPPDEQVSRDWSMVAGDIGTDSGSVQVLMLIGGIATAVAAWMFRTREFGMKAPEATG